MKKRTKTNTTAKKTAARKRKIIKIVLPGHSLWRHLRLIEHKHTGKLVHFRHTSHLPLMLGLTVLGFFLFASGYVTAGAADHSGIVSIGAIVPGPPPSVGAVITSPVNGLEVADQSTIEVGGTCPNETFIVIKNNGVLAGSTACSEGVFALEIELAAGENIISALDYDSLNQAGPSTPSVIVISKSSQKNTEQTETGNGSNSTGNNLAPILPNNPSIIAGKDDGCSSYRVGDLPSVPNPHVAVVCVPRLFLPGVEQTLGILVWGGAPPYIVVVDWNNGTSATNYTYDTQGYHLITFRYTSAGVYKINFKLTDKENKESAVQTAVQVTGTVDDSSTPIVGNIIDQSWFETPVPLYVMAVALTLGFWGGDIFDRKFGYGYNQRRSKKAN